ncbi:hypothetical protein ESCNG_40142 [Neisseria gonorrhoeae]|nr:hypothetical protein ESCNG_1350002 [Neisseria gonorrhoeae]SCW12220.1 hypothetical protein ESCNG_20147 [Neisseria gonorrhoeae]SCW15771.1 hypothetical protein ESCNG_30133 [Neisseria gonorrhoeae]SCW15936.1 hypothetical protein ESCNG_40142 [Neisseria gonorrhoeae]SCW18821.1 hypothetical protein ESCNG_40129 [Neisseria gonorrhoeae]
METGLPPNGLPVQVGKIRVCAGKFK